MGATPWRPLSQACPRLSSNARWKQRWRCGVSVVFCAAAGGTVRGLSPSQSAFAAGRGTEEALFAPAEQPWEYEDPVLHTAVGLLASATLLPSVFALTQIPRTAKHVWPLLDQFLAIFLAVAWLQSYDEAVDYFVEVAGHMTLAINICHTLLLYSAAVSILWLLRREKYRFLVCSGLFAHVVSFGAVKAAADAQEIFFSSKPAYSSACCLVVLAAILALLAVKRLCLCRCFAVSSEDEAHEEWDEVSDELCWDAAGMALAVLLTQAVHHLICGTFDMIQEPKASHTGRDIVLFTAYAVGLTMLGTITLPHLDREAHVTSWWAFHLAHVARNVLVMMVAWAHLLLLRWLVLEGYLLSHRCSALFAALLLAVGISGISMALIYCLPSKWHGSRTRRRRKRTLASLVLQSSSLVCAWCWEECFDEAIDALAEKGLSRVRGKFVIAVLITGMVAPIYVHFVKPKAARYEKD